MAPGLRPSYNVSALIKTIVADAAVGACGIFGSLAHSDHARPGSTFTTEGDLDAQGTQSRLHAPEAAGECPGIFGPAGAPPGDTVAGRAGLSTQEICGTTRPGAAFSHDLPHASGHRIGVDNALDRGAAVRRVGAREGAGGAHPRFARRGPK